ncbi:hypothetical protein [Frondihabitans australicus]|uniref:4-amino-4-deoxy-L-arabinose transferase-like glycosyltransferase n=1 Tax=Frondihabitans australicus TaxID=386892 RepID=A0A495IAE9_9MICO|nr:hypothetical protein [Frondihabitans australicus]RKR72989.1 hypothetical protein C8E83_0071 [Frondihabitans australicus]
MLDQLPTSSLTTAADRPAVGETHRPGRRSRRRAVLLELSGILLAAALGLGALAHLVLSARSTVFFYNGDSVLMPLVERSIQEGQAMRWAMSSVLFVFPEIPIYLGIAAVVPGVHADLMANAVVTLVLLYLLLRALTGVVAPAFARRTKIAIALAPIAALVVCSLLEHTDQRATLELVTLFLTTTYYYGTTLSLIAAIPLAVVAATGTTRRRRRVAGAGLVALSALATFSNPLFAMWASAPIALAAVILLRRSLLRPRRAVELGAAALGAAVIGYLARIPMAKYISIEITHYLRIDRMAVSVRYYVKDYFQTASTWQGAIEMSVLVVAVTGTLVVAILAVARRWPTRVTLALVISACSIVVTAIAAVVLGTTATRYLMPLFFAPAAAFVVLASYALERVPQLTGVRLRWPSRRILLASAVSLTLIASGLSVTAVRVIATAPSTQAYAPATCLSNWIAGRDLTGAGRYWTMRALKTYGDPTVKIVQITGDYNATLWLDNASDFTGQEVSYLVVDSHSHFPVAPSQVFGKPVQTVTCGQYTILDYEGTAGAEILTSRIALTAREKIAERHL